MYTQLKVLKKLTKFVKAAGNQFTLTVLSGEDYQQLKLLKKKKLKIPEDLQLCVTVTGLYPDARVPTKVTVNLATITEQRQLLAIFASVLGIKSPSPTAVGRASQERIFPNHPVSPDFGNIWQPPGMGNASGLVSDCQSATAKPISNAVFACNMDPRHDPEEKFNWSHAIGASLRCFFRNMGFTVRVKKWLLKEETGALIQITHICLPEDNRVKHTLETLLETDANRSAWENHPLRHECEVLQLEEHVLGWTRLEKAYLKPVGIVESKWPSKEITEDQPYRLVLEAASAMVEQLQSAIHEILQQPTPASSAAACTHEAVPVEQEKVSEAEGSLQDELWPAEGKHIRDHLKKIGLLLETTLYPKENGESVIITTVRHPANSQILKKPGALKEDAPKYSYWKQHPCADAFWIFNLVEHVQPGFLLEKLYFKLDNGEVDKKLHIDIPRGSSQNQLNVLAATLLISAQYRMENLAKQYEASAPAEQ